jgi:hypothetical protein
MVNLHATFLRHFLELAVANRISHVPPDVPQNHLPLKMAAYELDHLLRITRRQPGNRRYGWRAAVAAACARPPGWAESGGWRCAPS